MTRCRVGRWKTKENRPCRSRRNRKPPEGMLAENVMGWFKQVLQKTLMFLEILQLLKWKICNIYRSCSFNTGSCSATCRHFMEAFTCTFPCSHPVTCGFFSGKSCWIGRKKGVLRLWHDTRAKKVIAKQSGDCRSSKMFPKSQTQGSPLKSTPRTKPLNNGIA